MTRREGRIHALCVEFGRPDLWQILKKKIDGDRLVAGYTTATGRDIAEVIVKKVEISNKLKMKNLDDALYLATNAKKFVKITTAQ